MSIASCHLLARPLPGIAAATLQLGEIIFALLGLLVLGGVVFGLVWAYTISRPKATGSPTEPTFTGKNECNYCGRVVGHFFFGEDHAKKLPDNLRTHISCLCVYCARRLSMTCPDCRKDFKLSENHSFLKGYECPNCKQAKKHASEEEKTQSLAKAITPLLLDSEPGGMLAGQEAGTGIVLGRTYPSSHVDAGWLCREVVGFFNMRGVKCCHVASDDGSCVIGANQAVVAKDTSEGLAVRIATVTDFADKLADKAWLVGLVDVVTPLGPAALLASMGLGILMTAGNVLDQKGLVTFIDNRLTSHPEASAKKDAASIPQLLKELAELRDKGVLSEEEFARKKEELLRRL